MLTSIHLIFLFFFYFLFSNALWKRCLCPPTHCCPDPWALLGPSASREDQVGKELMGSEAKEERGLGQSFGSLECPWGSWTIICLSKTVRKPSVYIRIIGREVVHSTWSGTRTRVQSQVPQYHGLHQALPGITGQNIEPSSVIDCVGSP